MRARHILAGALTVLALALPPATAQAETREVPLETIPAVSGLKLRLPTGTYYTSSRGRVTVTVDTLTGRPSKNPDEYRTLPDGAVFKAPLLTPLRLRGTGVADLERFYGGGRIALTTSYLFRPDFRGPNGERFDRSLVEGYRVKSRTGEVISVKGDKPVRLMSTRVVPYSGELLSKDVEWSLEAVFVDGTNVVNRAQTRFTPRKLAGRRLPVRMLFYPAKITSKDAIFGFHLGSEVVLTYPSGITKRIAFKGDTIELPALPRGTYKVKVDAPGLSPERPVAVSRAQDVELAVISYLDLALVGLVLASIAIGLLVARRPHLRRLPARWRSRGDGAPAEDPAPADGGSTAADGVSEDAPAEVVEHA